MRAFPGVLRKCWFQMIRKFCFEAFEPSPATKPCSIRFDLLTEGWQGLAASKPAVFLRFRPQA